jgi:hypothetical protein
MTAEEIPAAELDRIWCFPALRQGPAELGTAVLARTDEGDRRRIYTARYLLMVKGKERGRFEADMTEVGSGPLERLPALLDEAHRRSDDEEPPVEVEVADWLAAVDDGASLAR